MGYREGVTVTQDDTTAETEPVDAELVASVFELGTPRGGLVEAVRGWGGFNVVYRFETARGIWAIKALHRELDANMRERFAIESAAFDAGIPMPQPIATPDGAPSVEVDGVHLRCHEWLSGSVKVIEETTKSDATRMGALVAGLHRLRLPWAAALDTPEHDIETAWSELAEAGRRRGASWAPTLDTHLVEVERLGDLAAGLRRSAMREPRVGSHRDLSVDNVLFTPQDLYLIDWDGAGPISATFERANYAVEWAYRPDGTHDIDIAAGFLSGYRDAGGEVTRDDPDTLAMVLDSIESWAAKNVRWALAKPSTQQDDRVPDLLHELLAAPATIEMQRSVLRDAISRIA